MKITIYGGENRELKNETKERMTNKDVLIIRFEDTGKGIGQEHLGSIFDPFFTKKSKGTGLGLAISKRIVQEHGGEITVESEVGKGSVFQVYLPVVQKSESE